MVEKDGFMENIVLDTNVLIDGIKDEYSAAKIIIDGVFSGKYRAFFSAPLRREYEKILNREINDEVYRQKVNDLFEHLSDVHVQNIAKVVTEDPEDDKVLATALAAEASVLVSADRHLLDLDPYGKLRIMRPEQFNNINKEDSWDDFARLIGLK